MSENVPPSPGASPTSPETGDWPAQAADGFVRLVDQVKAKTTRPVATAVRAVVYGLIVAILGVFLTVIGLVGLFRGADRLRNLVVADSVWLTYLVLGAVLVLVGTVVFAKRKPRAQE